MDILEQSGHLFWSALITGAVGMLFAWLKDLKRKHEAEQEEREHTLRMLELHAAEMKEWRKELQQECEERNKAIAELREQFAIMKQGGKAILADRILQGINHFEKLGEIPLDEKMNLDNMYKAYKACNGNSYVDEHYERLGDIKVVIPYNFYKMEYDKKGEKQE